MLSSHNTLTSDDQLHTAMNRTNIHTETSTVTSEDDSHTDLLTTTIDDNNFWEYQAGTFIIIYPHAMVIILGMIGNVLAFIVFTRRSMRRSITSIYFRVLSITESFLLIFGGIYIFVVGAFQYDWMSPSSLHCKILLPLVWCSCYSSCWLLVLMTIDRFIGVYFPHQYRQMCSRYRAWTGICAIITFLCLTVGLFYGIAFDTNPQRTVCAVTQKYKWFYNNVFKFLDLIILNLIPTATLVSLNIAMVIKIYQAASRRHSTMAGELVSNDTKVTSATIIILSASFVYLLSTLSWSTRFLVENAFIRTNPLRARAQYYLYVSVCVFLYDANHAVNFFLYCIHGSQFKREFLALFGQKKAPAMTYDLSSEIQNREMSVSTNCDAEMTALHA